MHLFSFFVVVLQMFSMSHRDKTNDWPMLSRPTDVLNDYFVCYQDLSEYAGFWNIEQEIHSEPALKSITKPKFELQPHIVLQQQKILES